MLVAMVDVRHVGMAMPDLLMLVWMAVSPWRHGIMHMVVMAVVVGMGMFMLKRLMTVLVFM